MKIVVPRQDLTVPVEHGRRVITLTGGVAYVMHDVEAAGGAKAGVFAAVGDLHGSPRRYAGDAHEPPARLLLPFIGGLGDAVAMLPVLDALRSRHAGLGLVIASTPGPGEVFDLAGLAREVLPYPPTLAGWRTCDGYLTMEAVHETDQRPGRPLAETFAAAMGVELRSPRFDLSLPVAADRLERGDGQTPLVGVAAGDGASLRAYPLQSLRVLLELLADAGAHPVVLGLADPAWEIAIRPERATDMRSRTGSVLELAVWLSAMDVVVTHDSFIMHLAGALGRPCVALFAPTSAGLAPARSNVSALASDASCAPCHAADGRCPLGHGRCIAWESAALAPARVARQVLAVLAGRVPAALAAGTDQCYNGRRAAAAASRG